MKTKFTKQERLLNHLILHSVDNPHNIGLLTGQSGMILVLTNYARQYKIPQLEMISDFLFDNIRIQVGEITDISFSTGICGICWTIEYLVQHGIMPGPAEDICGNTNELIASCDICNKSDFSLETGLVGLWNCVWARIQGNLLSNLELPFPTNWLSEWLTILTSTPERFPNGSAKHLRAAIKNKLNYIPLDFKQFIKPIKQHDIVNLSLQNGLAGYITLKYLVS